MFFDILDFEPNDREREEIEAIKKFCKIEFIDKTEYFFGNPNSFDFSKRIFVTNTLNLEKKFLIKLKEREKILVFPLWLVSVDLKKFKKILRFMKKISLRYCILSFPRKVEELKSPKQLFYFSSFFNDEKNQKLMQSLIGEKDEV